VFDGVISITQDATEGCDVVMYTMTLGYDIEEMTLETNFSDGEAQEEWKESTVCTLAFVPSESRLVKAVIDQVPPNSLEDRGVSQRSDHKTKVEHLNGYLAHQGWVLILVDGATEPLSAEDMFLVKLSPARLFHSSVRKVVFVDENFSHTPLPDDAQFLASETSRGVFKKRTITGPDAKGKKTKYKLPEEPQRRAVLVVSPMRHIPDEDGHKMPLKEVTLSLMKELELDPEQDYSRDIRAQQEYYTRQLNGPALPQFLLEAQARDQGFYTIALDCPPPEAGGGTPVAVRMVQRACPMEHTLGPDELRLCHGETRAGAQDHHEAGAHTSHPDGGAHSATENHPTGDGR